MGDQLCVLILDLRRALNSLPDVRLTNYMSWAINEEDYLKVIEQLKDFCRENDQSYMPMGDLRICNVRIFMVPDAPPLKEKYDPQIMES